jgi:hypothetical protein
MRTPGYLYVLVNPSMEGLVKVGRTTRDPKDRVNELSSATGVPTSFLLVFHRFFNETERAEQLVHEMLEEQGYRISPNREFFNAPPHEVIEAILQIDDISPEQTYNNFSSNPAEDDEKESPSQSDDFLDTLEVESGNSGQELMKLADAYYYGHGDTLEDYREALRLYKQAAHMGAIEAYKRIGIMYYWGKGCNKNWEKALDFLKEGVKKGDNACYAEMAEVFCKDKQFDKAKKCWKRFFNSGWTGNNIWDNSYYYYNYLRDVFVFNLELDHFEEVKRNKRDIQYVIEEFMKDAKEINDSKLLRELQEMHDWLDTLGLIEKERVPGFLKRVIRFFKFI